MSHSILWQCQAKPENNLKKKDKRRIFDFVSINNFVFSSCVAQMLERSGSPSAGDVIILITTGSSSGDQVQSALALASRKQVRVSVVAFAYVPTPSGVIGSSSSSQYSYQAGALRNLQSLAEATGGRMTAVASKGVGTMSHISMLVQLGDALVATLEYHQGSDNVPALVRSIIHHPLPLVARSYRCNKSQAETHSSLLSSSPVYFYFYFKT